MSGTSGDEKQEMALLEYEAREKKVKKSRIKMLGLGSKKLQRLMKRFSSDEDENE